VGNQTEFRGKVDKLENAMKLRGKVDKIRENLNEANENCNQGNETPLEADKSHMKSRANRNQASEFIRRM
jgi:hypothetical protein